MSELQNSSSRTQNSKGVQPIPTRTPGGHGLRNVLNPLTAGYSVLKSPVKPRSSSQNKLARTSSVVESTTVLKPISVNSIYESIKTNAFRKGNEGANSQKSIENMEDLLSEQKKKEYELVDQNMKLQNEKADWQFEITKLTTTIEKLESERSIKNAELSNLNKLVKEAEARAAKSYEETITSFKTAYKAELKEKFEKVKTEYKTTFEKEQERVKSDFALKEGKWTEMLEEAHNKYVKKVGKLKDVYQKNYDAVENERNRLEDELHHAQQDLDEYKLKCETLEKENESVKGQLSKYESENMNITGTFQTRIQDLEQELERQKEDMSGFKKSYEDMKREHATAKAKLFKAETARRKLHNQVQDLKGNIRVYCRVRPVLENEKDPVDLRFPDEDEEGQQLQLAMPGFGGIPSLDSLEANGGGQANRLHSFTFDKVFNPDVSNQNIFEEVSQLVQSALDGYNVCIFAYGQTGSGKTFTMASVPNGIIPLAINQIFDTAEQLKETGWDYEIYGEFLEIYNERINDLLGKPEDIVDSKAKYEIRHDVASKTTTVIGLTTVKLETPKQSAYILQKAEKKRSYAATMANERSSRSHSVFILRLKGRNRMSGKTHNGVLNLIDLAGSERLSHSQAVGDRLKETQAINKSLSSLGDVISALGNSKDGTHIPYRNSKLTYLLQYSLSGNSKTLMFVNISPLKEHANETVNSLRFATKVRAL